MRYLKIPLILLALVGLIALAGCGDDDDSSSSTETTSTSTESTTATTTDASTSAGGEGDYAQELTSIISEFGTSFQTLGTSLQSASDQEAIASGIDELEAQIGTTIDDLIALEAPPEAQEGQDQMVAAFEGLSAKLTDVSDAVDSGDEEASQAAAQELQAAAATFQTDFSKGLSAIAESGVQVNPTAGG